MEDNTIRKMIANNENMINKAKESIKKLQDICNHNEVDIEEYNLGFNSYGDGKITKTCLICKKSAYKWGYYLSGGDVDLNN